MSALCDVPSTAITQASNNLTFGHTADLITSLAEVVGYVPLLLTQHPFHPLYGHVLYSSHYLLFPLRSSAVRVA